ncbi:hypothetical protein PF011_g24254 [Phytophthora fragariae]|uniref:Uncharacterized protein n=1 Tax=Phytophthora fragariae TaxID=53985 RepID=A0A6A3I6X1_9STRA|nr:hypothetical protein PF011_g24254 [Phytophthora fragariae]
MRVVCVTLGAYQQHRASAANIRTAAKLDPGLTACARLDVGAAVADLGLLLL